MPEMDLATFLVLTAGFALGGLAKGTFGLGMPLLALPVLVTVLPYQVAVALFVVPNLTANFQQAIRNGLWRQNLQRYFWLLVPMLITIPFVVQILVRIEQRTGLLILGIVSLAFVATQITPVKLILPRRWERIGHPIAGIAAGVLCGLSGLYGPILIVYLLALRVVKDEFVSALALMYFLGTFPLYGSLALEQVLTWEVAAYSVYGAVIIGLMILLGQRIRDRLEEKRYRILILGVLFVIGCDLMRRALL